MGRAECFLTCTCLALAMRGVFVKFFALLTHNAVAKRCVFADLYTWFIYKTLYIRLKLAGSSHILTKFMNAQRHTVLFFVNQDVGCASCMCDWGISIKRWILMKCFNSLNRQVGTDANYNIWPEHCLVMSNSYIVARFFVLFISIIIQERNIYAYDGCIDPLPLIDPLHILHQHVKRKERKELTKTFLMISHWK